MYIDKQSKLILSIKLTHLRCATVLRLINVSLSI